MSLDFPRYQVFLNYPFDADAEAISLAMHFAVVAAGLLPVCALDLTSPDRPRLDVIEGAITRCQYSAHDLSRFTGEGEKNLARFNMPFELGGAFFQALRTQNTGHRCAFFVTTPHDYKGFLSDLAGVDPLIYDTDVGLLLRMYEWLRDIVHAAFIPKPSVEICDIYAELKGELLRLRGSGRQGRPTHHEAQELMYQTASEHGLWDWRVIKAGQIAFPEVPLSWID